MIRGILLATLLYCAVIIPLQAQSQNQLTLQQCVKIALDSNLTVRRSYYNVETNKVNLLSAKGAFLPSLNGSLSYNRNYGRNLNPVTYTYVVGVTKSINPSISSSWTLFNGLRIQNTFRSNQRSVVAANLDLEKSKNDVIINVVTYYTNVILNKELYENAKFQLTSSQQQLDKITKQVEVGALPKSNQLNQEAIVATNETNLITQENALNISLLQLKQSMLVPSSTPLDVVVPDIAMEDLVLDQTPEEIYKVSTQSLPQVKSARLKVESAQFAVKAARGSYLPRLSLNASATSNYNSASDTPRKTPDGGYTISTQPVGVDPSTNQLIYALSPTYTITSEHYGAGDQLKDNLFKNLGFSLTIPILNGLQTRTNVEQAIINKKLAEVTVKETEMSLRQSIETAYTNAIAAAKRYTAAVKQVSASEEAYRMTKQRLDNGAANFVEFQISTNDLFSAKSSLAQAKFNFILTKKVLDFYQGKSIEY